MTVFLKESQAAAHGLSGFWQGGSKLPAINRLPSETRGHQRSLFCGLLVGIVRRGIVYRQNKGEPIAREDIVRLGDLVAEVGFKIPQLHDLGFLDTFLGLRRLIVRLNPKSLQNNSAGFKHSLSHSPNCRLMNAMTSDGYSPS